MTYSGDDDLRPGGDEPEDDPAQRERRSLAMHRALTENLPDTTVFLLDRQLRMLIVAGEGVRERRRWLLDDLLGGAEPPTEFGAAVAIHARQESLDHLRAALAGERRGFSTSSEDRRLAVRAVPVHDSSGERVESVLVCVRDASDEQAVEELLARRVRQQAAVAQLGQLAIDDREPTGVIARVVATVSSVLDMPYSAVLALSADGDRLEMVAGAGFDPAMIGGYDVSSAARSQTAMTLTGNEPVVVSDYESDERFERSPMLAALGVRSGASVVIGGRERPYGVLAVLGETPRELAPEDVDFLRAIANLLAATLQRHADEQRYRHAALHDPLTELPNRTLILDRLSIALHRREREEVGIAVLMLDLDGFKVINDSLGHGAGDELLLAIAPRLRAAVRVNDSVGRLGGDEFVAVCEVAGGAAEAAAIAQRIADAVSAPVRLAAGEQQVTASIGIAVASGSEDTPESLLRDADAAMYRAKARGRGRYELFDDAMRERVVRRLRTETELRTAIERDELLVHYQPIFDVGTGRPVAVEALMRWQHPERGLLPAREFLTAAEDTGLIVDAGWLVLEQACREIAGWQSRIDPRLCLSVNVSGRQLAQPGFARRTAELVREYGMTERTLGLEATEMVLLDDAGAEQPAIAALVAHGLRLELDGFGTGYSSLAFLRRFPLEALKIDRSLVVDVELDRTAAAIVEAVLSMSASLDLAAVVEGIENQEQLDRIVVLGARHVQGHHLSRPLPAGEMEAFLRRAHGAEPA